ncbi:MAG TPA: hypothetical protein VED02_07135 [Methyloceanibacter sp.]|nr:hypothetical protein [Methyloceanibacter sp.]
MGRADRNLLAPCLDLLEEVAKGAIRVAGIELKNIGAYDLRHADEIE